MHDGLDHRKSKEMENIICIAVFIKSNNLFKGRIMAQNFNDFADMKFHQTFLATLNLSDARVMSIEDLSLELQEE